jgi:DNA-binding ferritin-like protein
MKEELILKLVQIQNQFRFLHWQTFGDAKHRAYGEVYDSIHDHLDTFAEAMMGKYGRPEFPDEFVIAFQDIKALSLQNFIDGIVEFLVSMTEVLDSKYDTDLLNIRDEILAAINKTKFLLTLKS